MKIRCTISRYDKAIKEPPYLLIEIDKIEVERNEESETFFIEKLRSLCRLKGYIFKFYTTNEDKYNIVVD